MTRLNDLKEFEILENISNGCIVLKPLNNTQDFEIVYINRKEKGLEKLKKPLVSNRKILEIFPFLTKYAILEILLEVWKTGKAKKIDLSTYRIKQKIRILKFHVSKIEKYILLEYIDETEEANRKKLNKLTGLFNYNYFEEQVFHLKNKNIPFTLVKVEIQNLDYINKFHGLGVGNNIVKKIANNLKRLFNNQKEFLSESSVYFPTKLDNEPSFALIILGDKSLKDLNEILATMTIHLSQFYDSSSLNIVENLDLSIYLGACPSNIQDMEIISPENLLKYCSYLIETAMGKSVTFQIHVDMLYQQFINQENLEKKLSLDIANGFKNFHLNFQPIKSPRGELKKFEVLIRWKHRGREVRPDKFISTLEKNTKIIQLGYWIIERAAGFAILVNTERRKMGKRPVRMAINLSHVQLGNKNLYNNIMRIIKNVKIDKTWLEFEITESGIVYNNTSLKKLKEEGFTISLDDFGTGYSNRIELRNLPISTLKIPREFIFPLTDEKLSYYDRKSAEQELNLMRIEAKMKNLEIVAEGVENDTQLKFLSDLGVHYLQGYHPSLGRPLSEEALGKKYFPNHKEKKLLKKI